MSKRKYKASDIAAHFLWIAAIKDKSLTNKKLQKLVYYSQAWGLVLLNKPFFDDKIEAWIHGPVVANVYHEYKNYGFGHIKSKGSRLESLNNEEADVLDEVWRIYGKYDADYLEILTHSELPWIEARGNLDDHQTSINIISQASMKSYYTSAKNG